MADQGKTADQLKLDETAKLGGTAIKPVGWDRTGWEAFQYMLWNPDTGEVLTRTPLSWLKITVFYCIYYTCLAGFWIACLQIFFQTLPETTDGPKWKLKSSLIGQRPGVGMRPRNTDARIDSQMFVLDINSKNQFPSHPDGEGDLNADYATRARKFLEVYNDTDQGGYNTFSLDTLGDCKAFPYGYTAPNVAPCVFIKLNTIWDWQPEPYNCEKDDEDEPVVCEPHIQALVDKQSDSIFVDCQGRYAADKEALGEDGLTYFPKDQSLPLKYFPYTGQVKECPPGKAGCEKRVYHSPLVAVKVSPRSEAYKGQLIHIECRAYYFGVKHITKSKEGLVQFEVQIKDDVSA